MRRREFIGAIYGCEGIEQRRKYRLHWHNASFETPWASLVRIGTSPCIIREHRRHGERARSPKTINAPHRGGEHHLEVCTLSPEGMRR
jgi:hypothetical protein